MTAGRSTIRWTTAVVLSVALAMAGAAVVAQRGAAQQVAARTVPARHHRGPTRPMPGA